ncbi:DNA-binding transcriptional regulator, MarR family [Actinopolymorpha cephalotaxi]|nr:MarR family transcriptional regulator [Actinopolymorpha cephalotaxi]SFF85425.1 DNA-binding transcriptional regulator, MarR family [Actinopolymorpha cephalotaxi]
MLVLGRIQRLASVCDPILRPPFADAGLAPGDFDVLAALRRSAPPHALPSGELARATLVTPGAVTKRVDRLAAAGLVTRTRDPEDARGRIATLTTAGRRLVDKLMRAHMLNEAAILETLDDREQRQLASLLGKLLTSVETLPSTGGTGAGDGGATGRRTRAGRSARTGRGSSGRTST